MQFFRPAILKTTGVKQNETRNWDFTKQAINEQKTNLDKTAPDEIC